MARVILGMGIFLGGIALAVYFCGYVMFFGSIMDIVDTVMAGTATGANVAIDVVKILLAGTVASILVGGTSVIAKAVIGD